MRINLYSTLLLSCLIGSEAQSQLIPTEVNTTTGIVYLILILLFVLNIATPIIRCLYLRYVRDLIARASEKLAELRVKIRDRMTANTQIRRPVTAEENPA